MNFIHFCLKFSRKPSLKWDSQTMVAPGAIAISVETMSSHFTATMSTEFPYNLRRFNIYFQKSSSFYSVYDQWLFSLLVFCNDVNLVPQQWLYSNTSPQHIKKMPPVLFSTNIVTKPPFYERKWTLQISLSLLWLWLWSNLYNWRAKPWRHFPLLTGWLASWLADTIIALIL